MDFRVLGPVEVFDGHGAAVQLAPKPRLLLATLLARASGVASVDALIDALWGDRPPASAVHVIHNHVSVLRAALEPDPRHPSLLVRTDGGYRLTIDDGQLDSGRFERLLDSGRRAAMDGHPREAAAALTAGLALWRGPAFGDLADSGTLRHEARRLDELRLLAVEEQIDARIAVGAHAALVGELETLVAAHPLREHLWAQLIRCLYRSGRQADALAAYQRLRTRLHDDLGLDPSPALQSLEAQVLAHAPELSSSTPLPPGPVAVRRNPLASPVTRYVRTPDGVNIAYQVAGDGPVDFLVVPGWTSHLDLWWELWPRFAREISSFTRLILFDKRGMGLSDRPLAIGADRWVVDALAVLDAARSDRAVLFGMSGGGTVAAMVAARHPERVRSLVLYGSRARFVQDDTYPYGTPSHEVPLFLEVVERDWGTGMWLDFLCPSAAGDPNRWEEYGRLQRMSASPATAAAHLAAFYEMDIRHELPAIKVPTLLLSATGDRADTVEEARYMADRIPGAELVELDSDDHLLWISDRLDDIVSEIRRFVSEGGPRPTARPVLAMIVTVVGGDDRVRRRAEEIALRAGGHTIAGGGEHLMRWRFGSPGTAIRCARSLLDAASGPGPQPAVGAHCGECETRRGGALVGPAVDIADAIGALARPGEILVSQTVRDLLVGSAVPLVPRGEVTVPGVPGRWQVLAVSTG